MYITGSTYTVDTQFLDLIKTREKGLCRSENAAFCGSLPVDWISYNVKLWLQSLKWQVLTPRACTGFCPVSEVKPDTEKFIL